MAIDLTTLAALVQTIVITLTLIIFIFQFRSQEKAIRESSYQNVLGRYNDYVLSGSGADDINISRLLSPAKEISKEELAGIRRLMIAYGIIEETFELYSKGWIDKETWDQWDTWLRAMTRHPQFAKLHAASTGMFDTGFQKHVTELLQLNASQAKK